MGKSKDLATGETRFVNTAGDTMTGALTVGGAVTVNPDADSSLLIKDGGTNALMMTAATGDELYIGANNEYAIRIKNDGTKDVAFDNGSRVTMPSQPSFLAYRAGSNYTTTTANWEKLILDGTRWNTGSHYSTSNHRFTAPISGVYHFDGGVNRYYIPAGNLFRVALYVNGSAYIYGQVDYSDGTSDLKYIVSSTMKLDANDYVELWSYSNYSGSNGFSAGATWNAFSGYLVG
jgi:hypothetical protein